MPAESWESSQSTSSAKALAIHRPSHRDASTKTGCCTTDSSSTIACGEVEQKGPSSLVASPSPSLLAVVCFEHVVDVKDSPPVAPPSSRASTSSRSPETPPPTKTMARFTLKRLLGWERHPSQGHHDHWWAESRRRRSCFSLPPPTLSPRPDQMSNSPPQLPRRAHPVSHRAHHRHRDRPPSAPSDRAVRALRARGGTDHAPPQQDHHEKGYPGRPGRRRRRASRLCCLLSFGQ